MSLTPEQEQVALELARRHPIDPARSFESASDLGKLARAVLHFAEQLERLQRTVKFQSDEYLKSHGGSWGVCKYQAERDALKADVARLHADLVALRLAHATGLPIGAIRDRLAEIAPPEKEGP